MVEQLTCNEQVIRSNRIGGSTQLKVLNWAFFIVINKLMDAKDQKIQSLEKDVARMKNAMNTFERQLKLMNSRLIRAGEQARRAQQEIDHLKRK